MTPDPVKKPKTRSELQAALESFNAKITQLVDHLCVVCGKTAVKTNSHGSPVCLRHALPLVVQATKPSNLPVGRNDPCPCGSGMKYKKCCIRKSPSM